MAEADGDDWDFSTGATWILAEKSGESALSIMAEANTGSLSRSEKIFFYYGDDKSDTTNYIIVTQAAGTQLSVDKSVIVFDENGGEASVNVSTNYEPGRLPATAIGWHWKKTAIHSIYR